MGSVVDWSCMDDAIEWCACYSTIEFDRPVWICAYAVYAVWKWILVDDVQLKASPQVVSLYAFTAWLSSRLIAKQEARELQIIWVKLINAGIIWKLLEEIVTHTNRPVACWMHKWYFIRQRRFCCIHLFNYLFFVCVAIEQQYSFSHKNLKTMSVVAGHWYLFMHLLSIIFMLLNYAVG